MSRRVRCGCALATGVAVALGLASVSVAAHAGDFRISTGASGAGSPWRGDGALYTNLSVGYRFADVIGIMAAGRLGYASVDERFLTMLSIGVEAWAPKLGPVRPRARLAFIHQHEESISVIAGDFGSALLGIGDGIRHRAGAELAVGIDYPFNRIGNWVIFGGVEAYARWLPDELGPPVYVGGGLSFGVSYAIYLIVIGAFVASLSGCGGWTTFEDYPCPPGGTDLTYANFAKGFLDVHCNRCHAVDASDRKGAPRAYIFDTYDQVAVLDKRIFIRSAADNTTMPPGPDDPPEDERYKLADWIACKMPK